MAIKNIPVIMETPYFSSTWCKDVLTAVKSEAAKYELKTVVINYSNLKAFSGMHILVLGADKNWLEESIHNINLAGAKAFLICAESVDPNRSMYVLSPDRDKIMLSFLQYFSLVSRKKSLCSPLTPVQHLIICAARCFLKMPEASV